MAQTVIRVALVGLGEAGEVFAAHLLALIQERHLPIAIVAVVHPDPNSPVMLGFAQSRVAVFTDPAEVVKLGDQVDVIFDLSEDPRLHQKLRLAVLVEKNLHTIVAPRKIALLLWYFFGERGDLPGGTE